MSAEKEIGIRRFVTELFEGEDKHKLEKNAEERAVSSGTRK